ncbi:MAG: helix-turn-helix domain-containing protein [Gammaproteobacteria bacterium]|uniref:helix-turn-helix domain-containing protein n=1 Tax=Hydrogenophaga sp. TaxID=1904254 RepID=UPI0025BE2C2E|nr:helix-turn-helix domain-containing protein [Hydrogenophaga sp.]MBU4183238.1 helix-turn-helix domain-containing protein [Gammaproteobacteria bacterium]MBU4283125.1 helix-turn-helix domain-containing protein [Gammaproteobacteria bacterium]MBU4323479.1 helix-turn-helix domain-containing protein [Gammaproteobacteria bacterium]MCG2656514.1 helix-turn-helix domain-containing protein [Hydrogenophaga sp.]
MQANSLTLLSALHKSDANEISTFTNPYATEAQSSAVISSGVEFRKNRISAPDMLTTDEAADLIGVSRVTINSWIKQGRCIGVSNLRRGFKLPKWQFEPKLFELIQGLSRALGTKDGWALLSFLENSHEALNRRTPLVAMSQGETIERILNLALSEGH